MDGRALMINYGRGKRKKWMGARQTVTTKIAARARGAFYQIQFINYAQNVRIEFGVYEVTENVKTVT